MNLGTGSECDGNAAVRKKTRKGGKGADSGTGCDRKDGATE